MYASILFAQNNAPDGAAGLVGGAAVLLIFFWVLGLVATIFWLWMLIDALVYEPTPEDKILWFLVIFFLNVIGALIYLFARRTPGPRSSTLRGG